MRQVPEWFNSALKSYDYELSAHWHQRIGRFAVERKAKNTTSGQALELKRLHHRIANRPLRTIGLSEEQIAESLRRRETSQAHLEAMRDRQAYVILFFDECSTYRLEQILQALRGSDSWAAAERAGADPVRNPVKAANAIANSEEADESVAELRKELARRDDFRYRAHEAWDHIKWRTGQRVML